jgi:ankyrin repeat protein
MVLMGSLTWSDDGGCDAGVPWVCEPMASMSGWKCITRAAEKGDEGEVARLLDEDSSLLKVPEYDSGVLEWGEEPDPPLHVAAQHGHLGVVKLLVQRGAGVDATGFGETTALHKAATGGHEDVVIFLLEHGAEANSRDVANCTPLMCASMEGHMRVAQVILERTGPEALGDQDDDGDRALDYAAMSGQEEMLAFLLRMCDEADRPKQWTVDAVMAACFSGQLGLLRLLLKHLGEDVLTIKGEDGWTPLHSAAFATRGSAEVIAFLLQSGADCNAATDGGETPLSNAIRRNNVPVVLMLLKHSGGHGLNDRDEEGRTLLHMACNRGYAEIVRALLLAGANHWLTDQAGNRPFDLARDRCREVIQVGGL